jgi:hypothetical protein
MRVPSARVGKHEERRPLDALVLEAATNLPWPGPWFPEVLAIGRYPDERHAGRLSPGDFLGQDPAADLEVAPLELGAGARGPGGDIGEPEAEAWKKAIFFRGEPSRSQSRVAEEIPEPVAPAGEVVAERGGA